MPKVTKAQMRQDELTRAKLEMVAARERGEDALRPLLAQHPALAGDLIDFSAALAATSAYADVELTPETETIAMQARERAFASVFGVAAPAVVKAPAFASLKALRQARKISMPALARGSAWAWMSSARWRLDASVRRPRQSVCCARSARCWTRPPTRSWPCLARSPQSAQHYGARVETSRMPSRSTSPRLCV